MKDIIKMFFDRLFQLLFWAGLGFLFVEFALPMMIDLLVENYQQLREYFVDAPSSEQGILAGLGIF